MRLITWMLAASSLTFTACPPRDLRGAALQVSAPVPTLPPATTFPVLVGAGDVAVCGLPGADLTAQLLESVLADGQPGIVFTAGDGSNQRGLLSEYERCFGPTWGRFKQRIRPAVGNHDYVTPCAAGYFAYFGQAAGDPAEGWYSYELGDWHVVVLNGNCNQIGGCEAGSPQERWLRADLAAHPARCTAAIWHQPRFSSGGHGDNPEVQPLWQALYEAGAELVVNGHDHHYERFLPQTPDGQIDHDRGVRQFIVGTGGAYARQLSRVAANSEVRDDRNWGVLKLTLEPDRYRWEFLPQAGGSFGESGWAECH